MDDPWGPPRRLESPPVARSGPPRHLRGTKVDRGGRSSALRGRFGTIFHRFRRVPSVWRIGSGGSRSTFGEIYFFRVRERLGLDFAPPGPSFGESLTFLGRFLGSLDRSWGAPVGPKEAFWASSGAALGASGDTFGHSGAPWGLPMAPWGSGARFGVDLGSMFN